MAANIETLETATDGKEVIDKLNEIIDWLNGTTDADRVTNIQVSGVTMTITYINGDTTTLTLQDTDTTYPMASTNNDGLMYATDTYRIGALSAQVADLNVACGAIEAYNALIEAQQQYDDGGGGDGGGYDE